METNHRGFIAATAAAAPFPAIALPINHPDAALEAAWQRLVIARDTLDLIAEDHSQIEREQWAIVDEAEALIQRATATTPRGAALQLWVALSHTLDTNGEDKLVRAGDLEALEARQVDWNARCIFAALRSLEAQGA